MTVEAITEPGVKESLEELEKIIHPIDPRPSANAPEEPAEGVGESDNPEYWFNAAMTASIKDRQGKLIKLARCLAKLDPLTIVIWIQRAKKEKLAGVVEMQKLVRAIQKQEQEEKLEAPTHPTLADRWIKWAPLTAYGLGHWRRYEGGTWPEVADDLIKAEIKQIVKSAEEEGFRATAQSIASVMEIARLNVLVPDEKWDADPDMLPCKNGVLHIPTLTLKPHSPENHFTFRTAYDYDPGAKAAWFEYFIQTTALGEGTWPFLQEFAGYCLTTETRYELAVWLYGPRGSGKSTFVEAVERMVGDRASNIGLSSIENSRFSLGNIEGKTLLKATEQPQLFVRASDLISAIISGEQITVEEKFKPARNIRPVAKILWAMNELPRLPGGENGLYRRVKAMEFPERPEAERDPDVKTNIALEGSGILNWALAGLARLRERGKFIIPESVKASSAKFEQRNNIPGLFVEDTCIRGAKFDTKGDTIYRAYHDWCIDSGLKPEGKPSFFDALERMGFVKHRKNDGWYFSGIGLLQMQGGGGE